MKDGKTTSFEELIAWQKAHQLVLAVYKLTEAFPSREQFGLTSQFRRAAVSVAANIAEGYRKRTNPDKLRFMNIAQGSLEECRYFLILARDLQYGNPSPLFPLQAEVGRVLSAYMSCLR